MRPASSPDNHAAAALRTAQHCPFRRIRYGRYRQFDGFRYEFVGRPKKILPGQDDQLFIDGAFAHEERLMLDVALRTGQVRRVLWGVDFFPFAVRPDQTNTQFHAFLYQCDLLGWLPYVFSEFTTRMTFQTLTGVATIDPKRATSRDDDRQSQFGGQGIARVMRGGRCAAAPTRGAGPTSAIIVVSERGRYALDGAGSSVGGAQQNSHDS